MPSPVELGLIPISVPTLASLAPSQDTTLDQLRSFYRPWALPFVRHSPLPVVAQSTSGAVAKSLAQTLASKAVSAALPNINPRNKVATLDNVSDSVSYGRVVQNALTNNQVDPSKSGVLSVGSRPQSTTSAGAFVSTISTLTLYWDGTNSSATLTIYRDDGTQTGPFSGNQAITGLSSSTTYYIYAYFDEVSQTVQFASVAGAVGTPAIAYTAPSLLAAQKQIMRGHIPLWLNYIAGIATTSGGSGGGSGGSGGGGGGHKYIF